MVAVGERDSKIRRRTVDGQSYEDPHTVPAVGIRAGVRPLGKDGGGK